MLCQKPCLKIVEEINFDDMRDALLKNSLKN